MPNQQKNTTGLRQLLLNCLLNHNGSVKVNFLSTINVTVQHLEDAVTSFVQFFFAFRNILNAY